MSTREGLFDEETLKLLQDNLTGGCAPLITLVHMDTNWPTGTEISFKAGPADVLGKWPVVLKYRDHLGRLLVLLAKERAQN